MVEIHAFEAIKTNNCNRVTNMDLYLVTKFLHVVAAILWLGGGLGLMLLAALAHRAGDRDDLFTIIRLISVLAPRVFVPGSFIVLVSGLAMVWFGGLAFEAWLVFGLGGIAATIGIGMTRLGPLSGQIIYLVAKAEWDKAERIADSLLRAARVDYVLQFLIVFAMVAKPLWSDTGILAAMAAIAAVAVLTLLGGRPASLRSAV